MLTTTSGFLGIPGVREELQTVESEITWGPPEYTRSFRVPVTIDEATRDTGGTPTTLLRPGLLMGRNSTTLEVKEWTPTAADGTEKLFGVLLWALDMSDVYSVADDDNKWGGILLTGGLVKTNKLLIPGEASYGLNNDTSTNLGNYAKALLSGRFTLDKEYHTSVAPSSMGGWSNIRARTTNLTLTAADNNTLFTNQGAAGTVTFTLPAVAKNKGLRFGFLGVTAGASRAIAIAGPAASTLLANGSLGQTLTLTEGVQEGALVEVIGLDNAIYAAICHFGDLNTAAIA